MQPAYYSHDIHPARAETIGAHGASAARLTHWRDRLMLQLPRLFEAPVAEAEAVFQQADRQDDLEATQAIARAIQDHYSDVVVVGMGGSSMSAQALSSLRRQQTPRLHIVDAIDPHNVGLLLEQLPLVTTLFLVVSKTGTTIETLSLTLVFLRALKQRGLSPATHMQVLTQTDDNPLQRLAQEEGMAVIAHVPTLGGRFSILSNVGLIPAAVMGADIRALRHGAGHILAQHRHGEGAAIEAAALHLSMMEQQMPIHVLTHYSDRWGGLAAWHRQCWAESLGKNGMGSLAVVSRGVTDQHSQLQLFIEGKNDKLFTAITLDHEGSGAVIHAPAMEPRLHYLDGFTLGDICAAEQRATYATLRAAGRPLRMIHCHSFDEATVGALIMHFMLEIIFVAELLGINAFNQPAVEAGKRLTLAQLAQQRERGTVGDKARHVGQ
jgi:glucose-6-phosphate isomerase